MRFFAFKCFPDKYKGNLKEFLDYTCENLNGNWETKEYIIRDLFAELEKSIVFLKDLFAPDAAFSRYTDGKCNGRFNRSIYEILTYYFSIKEVRIAVEKKKEEFVNKFVELNDDQEFVYAVSNTTKDINRVVIRFAKVSKILEDLLKNAEDNVNIPKFELIEGKIQVIKTE